MALEFPRNKEHAEVTDASRARDVFLQHIDERFRTLRERLDNDNRVAVTIDGTQVGTKLGKGAAKKDWIARFPDGGAAACEEVPPSARRKRRREGRACEEGASARGASPATI